MIFYRIWDVFVVSIQEYWRDLIRQYFIGLGLLAVYLPLLQVPFWHWAVLLPIVPWMAAWALSIVLRPRDVFSSAPAYVSFRVLAGLALAMPLWQSQVPVLDTGMAVTSAIWLNYKLAPMALLLAVLVAAYLYDYLRDLFGALVHTRPSL